MLICPKSLSFLLVVVTWIPLGAQAAAELPPIDVTEKHLIDIVRYIEETANVNILVDDELQETLVTLHLQTAMGWLDSIKVLCDVVGAELRVITAETVRIYLSPRVSLDFEGASVREVCAQLVEITGVDIVLPAHLREAELPVSLLLQDLPLRKALETIAHSVGLEVFDEAGGRVLRLGRKEREQGTLARRLGRLEQELRHLRADVEATRAVRAGDLGPWEEPSDVPSHSLVIPQEMDPTAYVSGWIDATLAEATTRFERAEQTGNSRGYQDAVLLARGAEAALQPMVAGLTGDDQAIRMRLAKLLALADLARAQLREGPRTMLIHGYRFAVPEWWDEINVELSESVQDEEAMTQFVNSRCGEDTGTSSTWREAMKLWVQFCVRDDSLPIYIAHAYQAGGRDAEAARAFSDLHALAGFEGENAEWYDCYLAYEAGRSYLRIGEPVGARRFLLIAAGYADSDQASLSYYADEAGKLLRQ